MDPGVLGREARVLLAQHGDLLAASPACPVCPDQVARLEALDAARDRLRGGEARVASAQLSLEPLR